MKFLLTFTLRHILPLIILFIPLNVIAEEPIVAFTKAKNTFDAGTYDLAVVRFEKLLMQDMNNPALLIETHKYLGISYLFIGNEQKAEQQFLLLLNEVPNYDLDPLIFPIDAVDFFTEIKDTHKKRLKNISKAKAIAEKERLKKEEIKRLAEIEKLRRNVYLQKSITKNSKVVAMMPFGAGQFQNNHKRKGQVFLFGESFFLVSSIVTFALHESLRDESKTAFYSTETRKNYEQLEKGYRIANRISIISLCVMVMVGIVDSVYHFEQTRIKWENLDEKRVPVRFRPGKKQISKGSISPVFTKNSAGLGASFIF